MSGSRNLKFISILIFIIFNCCKDDKQSITEDLDEKFALNPTYVSDGFDFPVGKPNARNYYNAQKFGENQHLGEDWNGKGGGNSDLGDPIYSISNGYVNFARDIEGGWGKVVRIIHKVDIKNYKYIESIYAHCNKILVKEGTFVKRGQKIGTIGNVNKLYLAHLHFEIRYKVNESIGGGYSLDADGFINPTKFINQNRAK